MLILLYGLTVTQLYMTTGKTIALTIWTFIFKVMSLLFNMLSRFVVSFLLRNKCLLILRLQHHSRWFWSPRRWSLPLIPLFPHLFAMKWWYQMPWSLFFEYWVLSQLFDSPLSPSSRGSYFLPLEWYYLHICGCWYFSWQSWFQPVIHPAWHFT